MNIPFGKGILVNLWLKKQSHTVSAQFKYILTTLLISLTLNASAATSDAQYNEIDGLVIIEPENLTLPSQWHVRYSGDEITTQVPIVKRYVESGNPIKQENSEGKMDFIYLDKDGNPTEVESERTYETVETFENYSGDGYIEYIGPWSTTPKPESEINIKVKINTPGEYVFKWRARNGAEAIASDEANDAWLNINGDSFVRQTNGDDNIYDTSDDTFEDVTGEHIKFYLTNMEEWAFGGIPDVNHKPGGRAVVTFNTPGIYTIAIHGRSSTYVIDKIILSHLEVGNYWSAATIESEETLFQSEFTFTEPQRSKVLAGSDLTIAGTANVINSEFERVELYFDDPSRDLDPAKLIGTETFEDVATKDNVEFEFTVPFEKISSGDHSYYFVSYTTNGISTQSDSRTITASIDVSIELVNDAYYQSQDRGYDTQGLRITAGLHTSYLQFNFPGDKSSLEEIKSMPLSLAVIDGEGTATINAWLGQSSTWAESTLSGGTRPQSLEIKLDSLTRTFQKNQRYKLDLTKALQLIKNDEITLIENKLNIILTMEEGGRALTFASSEYVDINLQPELLPLKTPFERLFTVRFDEGLYGEISSGQTTQSIKEGDDASAPTVTPQANMKFIGWDTDSDGIIDNHITSVSMDTVAVALYELDRESFVQPLISDGLSLHLVAGIHMNTDESNKVINWQNLAYSPEEYISKTSPVKAVIIRPNGDDGKTAVRFDGWSFFDFNNSDKPLGPVTVLVTYSRDHEQTSFSQYPEDQRIFSSSDPATGDDQSGIGFALTTGEKTSLIPATTVSYSSDQASLSQLCIGADSTNHLYGFKGDILEVLVYDRKLSSDELTMAVDDLNVKWDVSHKVEFRTGGLADITSNNAIQYVHPGNSAETPTLEMTDKTKKHIGWDKQFNNVTMALIVTAIYKDLPMTTLNLKKGYNLVFLNINPTNETMSEIMVPIEPTLEFVKDMTGNTCSIDSSDWQDGIGKLTPFSGYLIKVNDDTTLEIAGEEAAIPLQIELRKGINIVPFIGTAEASPQEYFSTILDKIEYIRDDNGKTIRSVDGSIVDTIFTVKPNRSYIVKMKEETSFIFP